MRNITALKVLVIIIIVFNANYLYSQETGSNNYSFSISPHFGMIYGQSFELVYPLPSETKSDLLSELIWDMKPVFYTGIQADFGRSDIMSGIGFFSSLSIKAGIPTVSGRMEDRDWTNPANNNLTHFSSHTNRTRELFLLDAAIGASIPVKSLFYLKPYISGSWMHFAFSGRDGYYRYFIGGSWQEGTFSGEVIRYQQNWLLLAAGLSAGTRHFHPFSFELSFQISPLTYCVGIDEHLIRSPPYTFVDLSFFGIFYEPKGSISFSLNRVELSLEAAWRFIDRTKGETFVKIGDSGFYMSGNKAGSGLSLLDARFLVRIFL